MIPGPATASPDGKQQRPVIRDFRRFHNLEIGDAYLRIHQHVIGVRQGFA